jgi:hypothetical protein
VWSWRVVFGARRRHCDFRPLSPHLPRPRLHPRPDETRWRRCVASAVLSPHPPHARASVQPRRAPHGPESWRAFAPQSTDILKSREPPPPPQPRRALTAPRVPFPPSCSHADIRKLHLQRCVRALGPIGRAREGGAGARGGGVFTPTGLQLGAVSGPRPPPRRLPAPLVRAGGWRFMARSECAGRWMHGSRPARAKSLLTVLCRGDTPHPSPSPLPSPPLKTQASPRSRAPAPPSSAASRGRSASSPSTTAC